MKNSHFNKGVKPTMSKPKSTFDPTVWEFNIMGKKSKKKLEELTAEELRYAENYCTSYLAQGAGKLKNLFAFLVGWLLSLGRPVGVIKEFVDDYGIPYTNKETTLKEWTSHVNALLYPIKAALQGYILAQRTGDATIISKWDKNSFLLAESPVEGKSFKDVIDNLLQVSFADAEKWVDSYEEAPNWEKLFAWMFKQLSVNKTIQLAPLSDADYKQLVVLHGEKSPAKKFFLAQTGISKLDASLYTPRRAKRGTPKGVSLMKLIEDIAKIKEGGMEEDSMQAFKRIVFAFENQINSFIEFNPKAQMHKTQLALIQQIKKDREEAKASS